MTSPTPETDKEREEENKLSPKISVMKPILRFLQLLCENHNRDMQNLLRDQVRLEVLHHGEQIHGVLKTKKVIPI